MPFNYIFNFSAGPSKLPDRIVEQIGIDLYDWEFQGSSVMEISHRSKAFMQMVEQAEQNLRQLLNIPNNYKVLYFQGGASGQFAAIPLNLPNEKRKALYLNSGRWSALAAKEAAKYTTVDSELLSDQFGNITKLNWSDQVQDYDYVHYCANETVEGIEIHDYLDVGNAILVVDMSSNILSKPIDINKFGVVYAGAQKNISIAGLTLVIVREDLINYESAICPKILSWKVASENDSMINTPCTMAWYIAGLVYNYHLENGGLEQLALINQQKAKLLYQYIDSSDFYYSTIVKEQRSHMNVCFTTGIEELDQEICQAATRENLKALKGHKAVGGFRASIYNAMPLEGVEALIKFLEKTKQHYLHHYPDLFIAKKNHKICATVTLPGSKSISNRSLLLAALAKGSTTLHGLLDSDDTKHMINALKKLGINIKQQQQQTTITGIAGEINFDNDIELFLGNAGTAFRPLVALLATNKGKGSVTITGEPRLYQRPIAPLVDALSQLGANIEYLQKKGFAPLKISGAKLRSEKINLDASLSSQFLTALLMMAPLLEQPLTIEMQGQVISKPYIDLTIAMLKQFSVDVNNCNYKFYTIEPQQYKSPSDYQIEADASSASYFLALGAIAGDVTVKGIGLNSLQGDKLFAYALQQAGAQVEYTANTIRVQQAQLKGVDLDLNHLPDAAMTLAIVAAYAQGPTIIRNIESWRYKETDRIVAMATELRKFGIDIEEGQDYIKINPIDKNKIKAASVDTYSDHRMAMCFSLLCFLSPVLIRDFRCVNKTFPTYFELFAEVTKQ